MYAYFRKWVETGFFLKLWKKGLVEYDEMEGIAWRWQSINGYTGKAPLARESVGPNPSDRGKMGTKRHIFLDGRGVLLSLVVTGANRQDVTQAESVLMSRLRCPRRRTKQNLCTDKGYQSSEAEDVMRKYGYTPHVRLRGEEKAQMKAGYKPQR